MPRWDHTLHLKELWAEEHDDRNEQATRIAPVVAERVAALGRRLESKAPFLSADLEELAEEFGDVPNETRPSAAFNEILGNLYDLADAHRIWIA